MDGTVVTTARTPGFMPSEPDDSFVQFTSVDLYLFDIDGTLVSPKSGETFRKTADDWQWLPGRKEVLQVLIAAEKKITFITNQGGVGFGYFKTNEIVRAVRAMCYDLGLHEPLPEWYICYTHPKATMPEYKHENDFQRKPNPGMLLRAMLDFKVGSTHTLMVGDSLEDYQAAQNAGCHFQWADGNGGFFGPVIGPPTTEVLRVTAVPATPPLVLSLGTYLTRDGHRATVTEFGKNLGGKECWFGQIEGEGWVPGSLMAVTLGQHRTLISLHVSNLMAILSHTSLRLRIRWRRCPGFHRARCAAY